MGIVGLILQIATPAVTRRKGTLFFAHQYQH